MVPRIRGLRNVPLSTILGVLSPVHILCTLFLRKARFVGADGAGNRYYVSGTGRGKERRWVVYGVRTEASQTPPEWRAWLCGQSVQPPSGVRTSYRRSWQKPYVPDTVGGRNPALEPGAEKPVASEAYYEAWTPQEQK